MLSVEWSELGRIIRRKTASGGVLWIVEPEAQMKRVGGGQSHIRIKAEDLVEQNRLDANVAFVAMFADLNVGLIPGQTEAAFEGRVGQRPSDRSELRWTVKRSKASPGLNPSRSRIRVSFSLPRMTVAWALGSS